MSGEFKIEKQKLSELAQGLYRKKNYKFKSRINNLLTLKNMIIENISSITEALYNDLNRCETESKLLEIDIVLKDIDYMLKNLFNLMKKRKTWSRIVNFPSSDYTIYQPYGMVLVMGTWNYPLLLSLLPLCGSIAAGNYTLVKPGEYAASFSQLLYRLIDKYFHPSVVACVYGGSNLNKYLFEYNWDFVFFTGSTFLGKILAKSLAPNLIPYVLELGGKNPCIVDKVDLNLSTLAFRLVWGTFVNAGQTCLRPDFIFIHEDLKEDILSLIVHCIEKMFNYDQYKSPPNSYIDESVDYLWVKIINEKHFDRIAKLINDNKNNLYYGGFLNKESLQISPSVFVFESLDDLKDSTFMSEELFGPIMPIYFYKENEYRYLMEYINSFPSPLASYLFSCDGKKIKEFTESTKSGSVLINDLLMQLTNNRLPFGGVGLSGIGKYHGKYSFEAFSYIKTVMEKSLRFETFLRFPPYSTTKRKILASATKFLSYFDL